MSTKPIFAAGDSVYGIDGRKAVYVTLIDGDNIVRPLSEDFDGIEYPGSPETWDEVFTTPPTEVYDQRIAELMEREHELRAEVEHLESRRRDFEADERALKAKFSKIAALRNIDDFIEGRIPMFVKLPSDYAPELVPRDKAIAEMSRGRERGQKLLVLLGDSRGDLTWNINGYSDGSGTYCEFHPVKDEAEAKALVQARFDKGVAQWRDVKAGRRQPDHSWRNVCNPFTWAKNSPVGWLVVPDDVREEVERRELSTAQHVANEAEKRAARAQEELAEARARLAKATGEQA